MADQADDRPELGPMLREARTNRGWTVEHVSVALGFFTGRDGKVRVLNRTQVNRIEAGERALSAEEAWRFVEIYPELDALDLLRAANAIDEDASPEFRSMIEAEAVRRRESFRQGGNRRRSERAMKVGTHASDILDRQIAAPVTAVLGGPQGQSGDCTEARRAA
jgi:transcriptional regulator with XRE-family HTH domain